jgi:hypothetical protein
MDLARITAEYITTPLPDFKLKRYCSTCNHDFKENAWPGDIKKGTEGPEVYALGWAGQCGPVNAEHFSPMELWERGYCGRTMCFGTSHQRTTYIQGHPGWSQDRRMPPLARCMAVHSHFAIKCLDCVKLTHLDPDYDIYHVPTYTYTISPHPPPNSTCIQRITHV